MRRDVDVHQIVLDIIFLAVCPGRAAQYLAAGFCSEAVLGAEQCGLILSVPTVEDYGEACV